MSKRNGFAIVELLVVMVIIGVLSTLAVNYYSGSFKDKYGKTETPKEAANGATLQTDLVNAVSQLKIYQAEHDFFPNSNNCSENPVADSICLKASAGNTYNYQPNNQSNPPSFILTATDTGGTSYQVTNNSSPEIIDTNAKK